jgi:hypothetical protein
LKVLSLAVAALPRATATPSSLACTSLTRLIKAQHWIASSHDEFTDTVKQVIADLTRDQKFINSHGLRSRI